MRFLGLITVANNDDGNNRTATRSSLSLNTVTAHDNSVFEAGLGGNDYKIAFVADSTGAVSVSVDTTLKVVTVHFQAAVSTVGNVETAVAAMTSPAPIRLKTAGTGATILQLVVDEFAAHSMSGGTSFQFPTNISGIMMESDTDGVQFETGSDATTLSTFATTTLRGAKLYNGSTVNFAQGPFQVGSVGAGSAAYLDGILAIHNVTGGAVNVRVWGVPA